MRTISAFCWNATEKALCCFLCSALLAVLVLGITVMPEKLAVTSAGSVYGSFLLSREAGGYVLIALIAFVLGVAVTLLCLHYRKKQDDTRDEQSFTSYEKERIQK